MANTTRRTPIPRQLTIKTAASLNPNLNIPSDERNLLTRLRRHLVFLARRNSNDSYKSEVNEEKCVAATFFPVIHWLLG